MQNLENVKNSTNSFCRIHFSSASVLLKLSNPSEMSYRNTTSRLLASSEKESYRTGKHSLPSEALFKTKDKISRLDSTKARAPNYNKVLILTFIYCASFDFLSQHTDMLGWEDYTTQLCL